MKLYETIKFIEIILTIIKTLLSQKNFMKQKIKSIKKEKEQIGHVLEYAITLLILTKLLRLLKL